MDIPQIKSKQQSQQFAKLMFTSHDRESMTLNDIGELNKKFYNRDSFIGLHDILNESALFKYNEEIFHSLLQQDYKLHDLVDSVHIQINPERLLRAKWLSENISKIL